MIPRQAKYYCPQCKEIKTFTELEKITPAVGAVGKASRQLILILSATNATMQTKLNI
jgi:hypothetical protein